MVLRRRFNCLTAFLGLILTLYECNYVKATPNSVLLEEPSPIPKHHPLTTKSIQNNHFHQAVQEAPPGDEQVSNYNLNRLVNYGYRSSGVKRKQDFYSHDKTGQSSRSASAGIKRGRYAFVTDRIPTLNRNNKSIGRNSNMRRKTKDHHRTNLRYNLHGRVSEKVKGSIRSRNNSTFSSRKSKEDMERISPGKRMPQKKQFYQHRDGERKNGIFSQANIIDTDINYQEEPTEFVSHFAAEPTEYVYSSQRNGFVPVSGPFGNSRYYDQSRSYHRRPFTSVDYTQSGHASQPRAETRSFYSPGKDLLGSGNFEILRGGTFPDNDEPVYAHQQQHNDMLFEREVPYSNPILGFQGFNHFSSPLHSSLSEVIHVTASSPTTARRHTSNFVSTTAELEAVD